MPRNPLAPLTSARWPAAPLRAALANGCEGVAAINTIQSVMGINLETLRPEPCVEGHSTPGGYSSKAVKPIALAKVCGWLRGWAAGVGADGRGWLGRARLAAGLALLRACRALRA